VNKPERIRRATTWLVLAGLGLLSACATSASTDQTPTGPKPAVTVLLRVRSPDGPQVELIVTGASQAMVDAATGAVATSVFPDADPGTPQATDTDVEDAAASAAPITVPDQAMTFTVDRSQIDAALSAIHPAPRSVAVWICSDERRTVQVTTQAPGAVASDVESGSCKIVGTSLAGDSVSWTSTVAIGELEPPSLLPVAIITSVVLVLIALGIAYVRGRAAAREAAVNAAPAEPPVD
jgi:hypothetical protein